MTRHSSGVLCDLRAECESTKSEAVARKMRGGATASLHPHHTRIKRTLRLFQGSFFFLVKIGLQLVLIFDFNKKPTRIS